MLKRDSGDRKTKCNVIFQLNSGSNCNRSCKGQIGDNWGNLNIGYLLDSIIGTVLIFLGVKWLCRRMCLFWEMPAEEFQGQQS